MDRFGPKWSPFFAHAPLLLRGLKEVPIAQHVLVHRKQGAWYNNSSMSGYNAHSLSRKLAHCACIALGWSFIKRTTKDLKAAVTRHNYCQMCLVICHHRCVISAPLLSHTPNTVGSLTEGTGGTAIREDLSVITKAKGLCQLIRCVARHVFRSVGVEMFEN